MNTIGEECERIGGEVGRLVKEKNEAYGDAFMKCGQFLALLYPGGLQPDQYGDALALVRIFDKQMRIASRKDYAGESPYRDMAGYCLLGAAKDETEAQRCAAEKAPRTHWTINDLQALGAAIDSGSLLVHYPGPPRRAIRYVSREAMVEEMASIGRIK